MNVSAQSVRGQAMMVSLALVAMVAGAVLIGSFGILNYLNGYTLRAASSLMLPAYIGYWAWQIRDNLGAEPLIPIFGAAWLSGLPIGLIAFGLHQALT